MTVNLQNCKTGDKLITRHGLTLRYVQPLANGVHKIKYQDGSFGTRFDDGSVFKNKRVLAFDEDVMYILPKGDEPIKEPRKKR